MKKLYALLLIVGALAAWPAFAQETSVLEKARDGIKKGADATARVVKKGADATARGLRNAGQWIEKKTSNEGSKQVPQESPN